MKNYITTKEAAKIMGLSVRTIQRKCQNKVFKGAYQKNSKWLIPKETLKHKPLRVLSLFSGCGGMDLGLEGGFEVLEKSINKDLNSDWIESKTRSSFIKLKRTSFVTVFANDILPFAKTSWINYFSGKNHKDDVYKLESIVELVKRQRDFGDKVFPDNIDVVTGGFPCQDFSVSGKRKGFKSDKTHTGDKIDDYDIPTIETRGSLYMWMREVVSIVKPKVFIAENVKGLVSLEDVVDIIRHDFSSVGEDSYVVVPARVLHAADYGVPQSRERVIFIGFSKQHMTKEAIDVLSAETIPEDYDPYPTPTHEDKSKSPISPNLKPYVTVADALVDLSEPALSDDLSHMSYSKAKFMGKHCQGQTEVNLDGLGPTIRAEHHGNIEFRRLSAEHGGRYYNELLQGLTERRLSVRECARIQTFPDDYEFVTKINPRAKGGVSASKAYKLIGNAVPPFLAYHLAKRLEAIWTRIFGGEITNDSSQQGR